MFRRDELSLRRLVLPYVADPSPHSNWTLQSNGPFYSMGLTCSSVTGFLAIRGVNLDLSRSMGRSNR